MTSDLFASLTSARGIAFGLVSWGLPVGVAIGVWWLVAYDAWAQVILDGSFLTRVGGTGIPGIGIALIGWLLLTLVLSVNSTIIFQLYEGYYLPRRMRKTRVERHWLYREYLRNSFYRDAFSSLAASSPGDHAAAAELRNAETALSEARREVRQVVQLPRTRNTIRPRGTLADWNDYPETEDQILPTALGNRIRQFERYGYHRFDLDIIYFWYEFVAVSDQRVVDAIEDSRQTSELYMGLRVTTQIFAMGVWLPLFWRDSWRGHQTGLLIAGAAAILIGLLAKKGIIGAIADWSGAVRAMVNLHRAKVANGFGFELPPTLDEERRFWATLHAFAMYGTPELQANLDTFPRVSPSPGCSCTGGAGPAGGATT